MASPEAAPILSTELVNSICYGENVPSKTYPNASYCPAQRGDNKNKDVAFQTNKFDEILFQKDADPTLVNEARSRLFTVRSLIHLQADPKFPPKNGCHTMWFKVPPNLADSFNALDKRNKDHLRDNKETVFKQGAGVPDAIVEYGYHTVCQRYPTQDAVPDADKDDCVRFRVYENKTEIYVQDDNDPSVVYKGNIKHLTWGRPLYIVFRHRGVSIKSVNETFGSLDVDKIVAMSRSQRVNYGFNTTGMAFSIKDSAPPEEQSSEAAMDVDTTATGQPCSDQTVIINGDSTWGGNGDADDHHAMPPVF